MHPAQPRSERVPLPTSEVGLDPTDWPALEALGERMLREMLATLQHVADEPVWQAMPTASRAALSQQLPWQGAAAERIYEDFRQHILPYRLGNIHPRFWARVMGTGTPIGMLATMLTAGMNSNASGLECSDIHVEAQVLAWWKELLGFPAESSGILLSGASAANLVCLQVARDVAAGGNVVEEGLGEIGSRLRVYVTLETHNCVRRAMAMLGLGNRALHFVPTDAGLCMQAPQLRAAIEADRQAGLVPMAAVATAGTVMTGAIEPLAAISEVCRAVGVWLHVDAAFGAMLSLSERQRSRLAGLEQADSLAFDLHKWMSVPYGVGCALIRDAAAHRRSFEAEAAYLRRFPRGTTAADWAFHMLGPELSRGFRGLPVWMTMRHFGLRHLGQVVEQNIDQAQALAQMVRAEPELELLDDPPLNVVCFRFAPAGWGEAELEAFNGEILVRLQEEGTAVPNPALVRGRSGLRCAIVNHRTRKADLELLVAETLRLGHELVRAARTEGFPPP